MDEISYLPSRFFQNRRGELDVVKKVEHEMIDRHGAPVRIRLVLLFCAPLAMKNRFQNGPRFGAGRIQNGEPVSVILDDPATAVATDLRTWMTFLIYFEYECHDLNLRDLG
jgi:hypothetical protein